jgi:hypothetical protein
MQYKYCFRLLSLLVLMVCPHTVGYSCGPDIGSDDDRFALFRPELSGGSSLVPFYFTHYYLNTVKEDAAVPDQLVNCEEWRKYTGGAASVNDIYYVQYKTSPDDFLYAYRTSNWKQFEENSFVRWLRRHEPAMNYMAYAKQLEFEQLGNKDPWNESNYGYYYQNPQTSRTDYLTAEDKMKQAPDSFLRKRYAFQAVKLAYYGTYAAQNRQVHEGKEAQRLYEQELKGRNTIVARWALLYYALSHEDAAVRADYMLQAFDQTDEKKEVVYQWMDKEMLDRLENETNDPHTQALIQTIKGIRTPGRALTHLQRLYELEPGSKYLPLLIAREVNKAEDWIWSEEYLGFAGREINREETQENFTEVNRIKDVDYLKVFTDFLRKVTEEKKQDKRFMLLSLIHCHHMLGEPYQSKQYLASLATEEGSLYARQETIERIINLLQTENVTIPEEKGNLYRLLQKLEDGVAAKKKSRRYDWYYNDRDEQDDMGGILLMVSRAFKNRGDIVTAGLLYQKADVLTNNYDGWDKEQSAGYSKIAWFDRMAQPEDIDKLLAFKHQKRKKDFDAWIEPEVWAPDDLYLDLKGTKLLRAMNYDEAERTFEQIDDSFWAKNYEYKHYLPKTSVASVGTLLPVPNKAVTRYALPSKKLVLRDINAIRKKYSTANTSDSLAELSFLLGNCFFNISYYGKAWMVYSYGNSAWENEAGGESHWAFFGFQPDGRKYGETYYGLRDAKMMYNRALRWTSANRELKAKCLMMLWYIDHIVLPGDHTASADKYKKMLKAYANTQAYELALTRCPDFGEGMR